MKNYLFLLLALPLFFTACSDDEISVTDTTLNYDGANFSAPVLPQDSYEAAARFSPLDIAETGSDTLYAVEVYFQDVPVAPTVVIYGQGENGRPGAQLYRANLGSSAQTDSWTRHTLVNPIKIGEEDLWIAVAMEHPVDIRSVGCDEGPADENGDLLFVNSLNTWTNLRDFTNGATSINWNIRGVVE